VGLALSDNATQESIHDLFKILQEEEFPLAWLLVAGHVELSSASIPL